MTRGRRPLGRRAFLAASASALGSLAGCTRLSEFVVDHFVGDVNVFNLSEQRLTGSFELAGPDGRTLLDDSLTLAPSSGDEDAEPSAIYEDVLTAAGPHRLDLELDPTPSIDRVAVSETLQVADPAEEKIVVLLGGEVTDEFVTIRAVEDFAALEDDVEES